MKITVTRYFDADFYFGSSEKRSHVLAPPVAMIASVGWLLQNARNLAVGKDALPDKFLLLRDYLQSASDLLQRTQGETINKECLPGGVLSLEMHCSARIARLAINVTRGRLIALVPEEYVLHTLEHWILSPGKDYFVARMLDEMIGYHLSFD